MNTALALLFGSFSLWWVNPYGDKPYLPDSPPAGGIVTNQLACSAARGEIETISFSVKPERDMSKVNFEPSDLTGPGGAVIPASCADFALVKVWYRAGGRWRTSWAGNQGNPELINDLVLHDDGIIKVVESDDPAKRTVLLRIDYPEGPAYVDMRKHGGTGKKFNHSLHPVRDAEKFVPFDLRKDRFQQYWFTWKVPLDANPGLYKGTLAVSEDGRKLGDIPVEVEVYPFALPAARTHYDTSQPYISAWMGLPSLAGELAGCKQLDIAEKKVRAVYKSCAEHNANCPSGPGVFKDATTEDLAVRSLIMMRQEGMSCRLLINGPAFDGDWISWGDGAHFETPEQNPKRYAEAKARFEAMLRVQREVLDKYLGHHNCYFSSGDEVGTWFNRKSYGFWGLLHKYGFQAWTDYGVDKDISWSVGMNDVPAAARHKSAWNWHKGSAKTVTYAGPFTGPSCPDIWRRTKGLRYYYADFDGLHEYCFYTGDNPWNDFAYRGPYSQFQIIYLTYDGLIATLAWEGVREGLDDVRYLSLLRLRGEAALKSPDPAVQALGRRHLVWMDAQDPESIIDLIAFRREVARRAAELVAAVGEQPPDVPPKPAPELPPCTYGEVVPGDADKAALAKEYARNNRYDLAIPMWEKVRSDLSEKPARRFEAAIEEARLQSAILRRDDAVRTVDETIKMADLSNPQRVKLLLQRARSMMSPLVFEEEFTLPQLDAAAAVVADALGRPGATARERFDASMSMADAYLAGYHPTQAVAFVNARLDDLKLGGGDKCAFFLRLARAYTQMEAWDDAAKMYRIAHTLAPVNGRYDLQAEGRVAEKRGDWRTAVMCYSDEALTYSDEEKSQKASCVRRLSAVMKKLSATKPVREVKSIDDLDEAQLIIDLDE